MLLHFVAAILGRVLFAAPGWPGIDFVAQAAHRLVSILFPQSSKCWHYRCALLLLAQDSSLLTSACIQLDVPAHTCNHNSREMETGGS